MDTKSFNEKLKYLKSIIKAESNYEESIKLALYLHALVHVSHMSGLKERTYEDNLWDGLSESIAKTAVNKKDRTIVYGIWHSTRIEDITTNILIDRSNQILNEEWMTRINSSIPNTGNQLSPKEILSFSQGIEVSALKSYRLEVGKKTQMLIKGLKFSDFNRKFPRKDLDRIFEENAVARHPDAEWLVDFWGKKNVAGILFMPLIRHHLVHINESNQAKAKGLKKKG